MKYDFSIKSLSNICQINVLSVIKKTIDYFPERIYMEIF